MKKIGTIILGLTMATIVQESKAQLSVGLQGGVSTGSARIEDIGSSFSDVISGENIIGGELGLYGKLDLGPLYLRASGLYDYREGRVTYVNSAGSESQNSISLHKIQVPLMVGLHLIGPLALEAGPQYNYLMAITDHIGEYSVDVGKNGFGYRVGAALDFNAIFLNVSYQGVTVYNDGNNARFREPYKLLFGIGFRFAGGGDND